jgi:purine nucleosidase
MRLVVRVDRCGRERTYDGACQASDECDERRLEHDRAENRSAGDAKKTKGGYVPAPLIHLEQKNAKEKNSARHDRDDPDRPVEPADDAKRLRGLDRDIARPVRAEPECHIINGVERALRGARVGRGDGKAVDPVAVADQLLQMLEVQSNTILFARNLAWIGRARRDRTDDDGVAGGTRRARQDDAITDAQSSIGGQPFVDRDGARRALKGDGESEKRDERHCRGKYDREHQMPSAVLIDTDPGIDDAVALALAARLAELDPVGITTCHGNTDVARATRNAREIARRVGLDAPVVAGAAVPLRRAAHPARETHGHEGLGHWVPDQAAHAELDHAAQAIAEAVGANHRLTLICLGPLTNLARAVASFDHVAPALGPVFIMGGTVGVRGTQTRWSEFNWWGDPEAVEIVLAAGLDIRLVPLDVTRRIVVPGDAVRALREAGQTDDEARFWADALGFYMDFHKSHEGLDGCVVNDPLAVALAADPSLATWRDMRIGVSVSDDERRGAVIVDAAGGATARVATTVQANDVLALLTQRVFTPWLTDALVRRGAEQAAKWLEEHPQ